MIETYDFLKTVLDSLPEQIVVIDKQGEIIFCNQYWNTFAEDNGSEVTDWVGVNYLDVCNTSGRNGDKMGQEVSEGIYSVIRGEKPAFYYEYPCHSPTEKRWFMLRVVTFHFQDTDFLLLTHHNITERKRSEDLVRSLSRTDALTEIANRRYFNTFLKTEWRRCRRSQTPFTLAMVDIDHFKLLNDTYGHQKGDQVLQQFAALLNEFCRRPGDLCARYGGEEFALIWTDIEHSAAVSLAEELLLEVAKLQVPNERSPTKQVVTASIGLVTIFPRDRNEVAIITKADELLYAAKKQGRNSCVSTQISQARQRDD